MKLNIRTGYSSRGSMKEPPILHSGASTSMFQRKEEIVNGTYEEGWKVSIQPADGKYVPAIGTGKIQLGNLEIPNCQIK